jgi:RecA-family ATPase
MTARDVDAILRDHRLPLPPLGESRYYATCPQCSSQRRDAHKKLKCLGITITDDGVTFGCNHCGWTGGGKVNGGGEPFTAVYDYVDEAGEVLFQVCRKPNKDFPQRRPDGKGGWIWNTSGVRKVLYRLPETLEAIANGHTVLVVEGEKDVENLRKIGIPATCSPGGANPPGQQAKWRTEYSEMLRGADLVIIPDNDDAGRAHAKATAVATTGIAARIRMLDLAAHWPECPKGGDVSDWFAAGHTREQLDVLLDQVPDFTDVEVVSLPFVDMSRWDSEPVPEREWAVLNRIPLRQPTLFSGEGAAGKTLVALQLCAAHTLAKDWLRTLPTPGPAIYLGAEDDTDELHRRLAAIAKHYNARFADLIAGGLHILSYAGEDALLGVANRNGVIEQTQLFDKLCDAAAAIRPILIVLDTAVDVFAGNENDRTQVRQFVGLLRRLAITGNSGVLLCSHPSLTGISTGTGLSGSTGWHNSVRARMYMHAPATEPGVEPDPDLKQLDVLKNNYGPLAESLLLCYDAGVFLPQGGAATLDRAATAAKAEALFLELLARFNRQDRNVSDKSGTSYAPAIFAQEAEARTARIGKKALVDAMNRLFAANRIHVENYGRPSRPNKRLVTGAAPGDDVLI